MKICYNNNIKYYYAGIGSRKTPDNILIIMKNLAKSLSKRNYCLRSGGAIGADSAFEYDCDLVNGSKEIFYVNDSNKFLIEFVKKYHPFFDNLSEYAKKLHSRNVLQMFGPKINEKEFSKFVVCWTPDGYGSNNNFKRTRLTSGTGTAIQIALEHNIPVFNLQCMNIYDVIREIRGLE